MKIGIDCRTILNPDKGEGAGIGHYTYQLVRFLLKIDKKNNYLLFFDRSVQKRRLDKFKQENVVIKFFPFLQYSRLMPPGYSRFLSNAYLSREKLDVFHLPALSMPLAYRGNSIITAHDLAVYKFPDFYPGRQIASLKKIIPTSINRAKKIIAVSHATASDLNELFAVSPKKIEIIPHGVDKRFFKKSSAKEIQKLKRKLKIKGSYLLFLGTLDPRKNIFRIISAYERLRRSLSKDLKNQKTKKTKELLKIKLVLAGSPGFQYNQIKKRVQQSEFKKDILLPGYIESEAISLLFKGSEAFIFPSLCEGFGLPIIEAMASQTPVITSKISAMPEVAQGKALLVDPYNVYDIKQALLRILTDDKLKCGLIDKAKKYVQNYTWEKTARKTIEIYKQSLS